MAAQDVRELTPRVRRALEGPLAADDEGTLSEDVLLPWTADAIADIILFTVGQWNHTLTITERDDESNVPTEWEVDPALDPQEESVVAAQAALTYFFHIFRDEKTSEKIANEGQTWEYQKSATLLRDQMKLLQQQRDMALEALEEKHPVFARVGSILAARDRLAAAVLEPWVDGGLGGGQTLIGPGGGIDFVP